VGWWAGSDRVRTALGHKTVGVGAVKESTRILAPLPERLASEVGAELLHRRLPVRLAGADGEEGRTKLTVEEA